MGASAAKNLILGIVAVAVAGLAWQTYVRKTAPPPPMPATPPADAELLDPSISAESIILEYLGAKRGQREAVASQYLGAWIAEPGWQGAVEGSSDMAGTRAVSVYYYNSKMIGGGFWVLCNVSDPPKFKKGDHVRVRGQISAIESLAGGPAPIYRIVLEPAAVTPDPPG